MPNSPLPLEDTILLLLWSTGPTGERGESISGATRLAKELFFLQKEENVNFRLEFEPKYYGPYSNEIPQAVSRLREGMFLTVTFLDTWHQVAVEIYSLTPRGMMRASRLYDSLDSRTKQAFNRIKQLYNGKPLEEILDYVHTKYPEYRLTQ